MNWQPLIEFVVSLAYGILSAVVPIFNSEIYIVASQVGGFTEEITTRWVVLSDRPSARSALCSPCAGAAIPVWWAATRAPPQAGRSCSDKAASLVGPHGGALG